MQTFINAKRYTDAHSQKDREYIKPATYWKYIWVSITQNNIKELTPKFLFISIVVQQLKLMGEERKLQLPNKVKFSMLHSLDRLKTNILMGLKLKNEQCYTRQTWIKRKQTDNRQVEFRPKNIEKGEKKDTLKDHR